MECLSPIGVNFESDYKCQFGVAIHEAMDAWFSLEDSGNPDKMDEAFVRIWMPFEGLDPREIRTMRRGLDLTAKYREKYPIKNEPFKVKHIEVGFACELDEDLIYCGRMDKIVEWQAGFEGYVVLDHKTSSAKGYLSLNPNAALDGYIWGASQLLSEPVIGAMLDEMYLYKNKFDLVRELTQRSEEQIEIWKDEVKEYVSRIRDCSKRNIWIRNSNSCKMFFRDCEFKALCSGTNQITIDNLKKEGYEVRKWEPYPEKIGDES